MCTWGQRLRRWSALFFLRSGHMHSHPSRVAACFRRPNTAGRLTPLCLLHPEWSMRAECTPGCDQYYPVSAAVSRLDCDLHAKRARALRPTRSPRTVIVWWRRTKSAKVDARIRICSRCFRKKCLRVLINAECSARWEQPTEFAVISFYFSLFFFLTLLRRSLFRLSTAVQMLWSRGPSRSSTAIFIFTSGRSAGN